MKKTVEKNYKEFEKTYIGCSDVASLVVRFCCAKTAKILKFGGDGAYYARIITDKIKIPKHYKLEASGSYWMTIYDDFSRTLFVRAPRIRIYQAGMFGTIIYAPKAESVKTY